MSRILAGFFVGVIGVTLVWWSFLKPEEVLSPKNTSVIKAIPAIIRDKTGDTTFGQQQKILVEDNSSPQILEANQNPNNLSGEVIFRKKKTDQMKKVVTAAQPEKEQTIFENFQPEKAGDETTKNKDMMELNAAAIKIREDGYPLEFEPSGRIEDDLPRSSMKKKRFQKPFSLQSKADGFAGCITAQSGVECHTERIRPGEYDVYFHYLNETDRLAKEAKIKEAGINF